MRMKLNALMATFAVAVLAVGCSKDINQEDELVRKAAPEAEIYSCSAANYSSSQIYFDVEILSQDYDVGSAGTACLYLHYRRQGSTGNFIIVEATSASFLGGNTVRFKSPYQHRNAGSGTTDCFEIFYSVSSSCDTPPSNFDGSSNLNSCVACVTWSY